MSAGYHHFIIEQGATFGQTLKLFDSSNTVINLTGYSSGRMSLKETPDATAKVLELLTTNGRMALGGTAGTVTLSISASITKDLTPDDGVFDLEIVSGSGIVSRLIEGTYSVRRNITT